MSGQQFDRRGFLATAGGVASRDAFSTDSHPADPDAFGVGGRRYAGRRYADTDRDQASPGAGDFVADRHVTPTTDTVNRTEHGVRMSLADFP